MRKQIQLVIGALGVLTASLSLPGCKLFDLSNPFLPTARLYAEAVPNTIIVKASYRRTENTVEVTAEDVEIKVSSFPRDASPGVLFTSYSAEYFDQANNSIPTLILSKVNFGIGAYVPPASNGAPATTSLKLPIYNQQVQGYALDQVYSFVPEAILNRNLIHTIGCRVTLYGEDDNFNKIEVPLNVPITFSGQISQ